MAKRLNHAQAYRSYRRGLLLIDSKATVDFLNENKHITGSAANKSHKQYRDMVRALAKSLDRDQDLANEVKNALKDDNKPLGKKGKPLGKVAEIEAKLKTDPKFREAAVKQLGKRVNASPDGGAHLENQNGQIAQQHQSMMSYRETKNAFHDYKTKLSEYRDCKAKMAKNKHNIKSLKGKGQHKALVAQLRGEQKVLEGRVETLREEIGAIKKSQGITAKKHYMITPSIRGETKHVERQFQKKISAQEKGFSKSDLRVMRDIEKSEGVDSGAALDQYLETRIQTLDSQHKLMEEIHPTRKQTPQEAQKVSSDTQPGLQFGASLPPPPQLSATPDTPIATPYVTAPPPPPKTGAGSRHARRSRRTSRPLPSAGEYGAGVRRQHEYGLPLPEGTTPYSPPSGQHYPAEGYFYGPAPSSVAASEQYSSLLLSQPDTGDNAYAPGPVEQTYAPGPVESAYARPPSTESSASSVYAELSLKADPIRGPGGQFLGYDVITPSAEVELQQPSPPATPSPIIRHYADANAMPPQDPNAAPGYSFIPLAPDRPSYRALPSDSKTQPPPSSVTSMAHNSHSNPATHPSTEAEAKAKAETVAKAEAQSSPKVTPSA